MASPILSLGLKIINTILISNTGLVKSCRKVCQNILRFFKSLYHFIHTIAPWALRSTLKSANWSATLKKYEF